MLWGILILIYAANHHTAEWRARRSNKATPNGAANGAAATSHLKGLANGASAAMAGMLTPSTPHAKLVVLRGVRRSLII